MNNHTFDYLVDEIEPKKLHESSVKVCEMLHIFEAEGVLQQFSNYHQFLEG